jgi:hypothetical protein
MDVTSDWQVTDDALWPKAASHSKHCKCRLRWTGRMNALSQHASN